MTNVLNEPMQDGSIYEIPQQLLAGEDIPENVEHALARACVVHCAAAALDKEHAPSVDELIDFVVDHGAGSGSELYKEGVGWNIIGVADVLRYKGYSVISQNLRYGSGDIDLKQVAQSGRVRSDFEKERLLLLSEHGGTSRKGWLDAMRHTQAFGGKSIASIQIPLLAGGVGSHAVLIQEVDDQDFVTYFDPDHYNMARFGENKPDIERIHESELIYRRPAEEFLLAMTGELTHIYSPPKTHV